jgi:transposase-like protein
MSKKPTKPEQETRRIYTQEFKENAVRMLLDGHSASSICQRLGISGTNLLYRWKKNFLEGGNGVASDLEQRVRELEAELRRVERERDVLKKALSIFGRDG